MRTALPIALMLLTACATPTPGETTDMRRVAFACDNGERVEVRFFPAQGVASLWRNGTAIELQQAPSASGFVYSNGPNTIRGKGDDLTIEIGRMAPIQCRAG